jgi:hypothetical protein
VWRALHKPSNRVNHDGDGKSETSIAANQCGSIDGGFGCCQIGCPNSSLGGLTAGGLIAGGFACCQIGCPNSSLGGLTAGGFIAGGLGLCTGGSFRCIGEMDMCRFSVLLEQFLIFNFGHQLKALPAIEFNCRNVQDLSKAAVASSSTAAGPHRWIHQTHLLQTG